MSVPWKGMRLSHVISTTLLEPSHVALFVILSEVATVQNTRDIKYGPSQLTESLPLNKDS